MKYLNNLKYILLFTIVTFMSCAVDDDQTLNPANNELISVTLEKTFQKIDVTETSYDATINFSKPLTNFSRLYYSVNGEKQEADLAAGSSSHTITLDFSGTNNSQVINITNLEVLNSAIDNIETKITEDKNTLVVSKSTKKFLFILTWEGSSDLDGATISKSSTGLTPIDLSDGTDNIEISNFPDTLDDGTNYSFAILPYTVDSNAINCQLSVINNDKLEVFKAVLRDATPASFLGYSMAKDFVTIKKTTDSKTGEAIIELEQVLN